MYPENSASFFLPQSYVPRLVPEACNELADHDYGRMRQPEIMPLAERLLSGTKRNRLVVLGNGAKLIAATARDKVGIDSSAKISFCREHYQDAAEWRECDLGSEIPMELHAEMGPGDVVVCSNVIEHLPDPRPLLDLLHSAFKSGALVITSTPERNMVRGRDHLGPPPTATRVREWSLPEYKALLSSVGLPPVYAGLTFGESDDRQLDTIVSIHEPRLQRRFAASAKRPLAIISIFNEQDIIEEVIEHWIFQGCDVHVLDNWSTDKSWAIVEALTDRFGTHVMAERFPVDMPDKGSWIDILGRKEEIAFCHKGRWIVHSDADEIRLPPFTSIQFADALHLVELAGWNRVDFTVLNHRPINDLSFLTSQARLSLDHFEFGTKPGHFLQKKAWLQGSERISLQPSGGHVADFLEAKDCPYHFILHHFPLRSAAHGRRKILQERYPRWSEHEFNELGWHHHYDDLAGEALIWDPAKLFRLDSSWWETHGLRIISGIMR